MTTELTKSKKPSMYNILRSRLTNLQTMRLLDLIHLKRKKYFASNTRDLVDYLNHKFRFVDEDDAETGPDILKPSYLTYETLYKILEPVEEDNAELHEALQKGYVDFISEPHLIIQGAHDVDRYTEALLLAQDKANSSPPESTFLAAQNEPYQIYYSRAITTIQEILNKLDDVYSKEGSAPFKIHFAFGCIYETSKTRFCFRLLKQAHYISATNYNISITRSSRIRTLFKLVIFRFI